MFANHFRMYLVGALESMRDFDIENASKYFSEYVNHYVKAHKIDDTLYTETMLAIAALSSFPQFYDDIMRLMETFELDTYRQSMYSEQFSMIRSSLPIADFLHDDRIHDVLKDLIPLLQQNETTKEDKLELFSMEYYIINMKEQVLPSKRILKSEYPKLYVLHGQFFDDVRNPKKHSYCMTDTVSDIVSL